jgi:hypothetical protein
MAVSILECLMNAEFNFKGPLPMQKETAMRQLHNAVSLLEKGYSIDDEVEPILEKYGSVENVPEL